jgi:hypothetical protein
LTAHKCSDVRIEQTLEHAAHQHTHADTEVTTIAEPFGSNMSYINLCIAVAVCAVELHCWLQGTIVKLMTATVPTATKNTRAEKLLLLLLLPLLPPLALTHNA